MTEVTGILALTLMKTQIEQNEILYRAIKRSRPEWLNEGKPTPEMFKDNAGVSVDRGDNRSLHDVIAFMETGIFKKRLKGVASLSADQCMSEPYPTKVVADPSTDNPYHANIFLNDDMGLMTLQAIKLANISKIEFINESMSWTQKTT